MSARRDGSLLWEVRWPGGGRYFVGTLHEQLVSHTSQVAWMNRRHRKTGIEHTAQEVGP